VQRQVGSGEQPRQLYLAGVLAIARRRWWALLAGSLAGAVLVVLAGAAARTGYEGSVKLLVGPIGGQYTELRAASQQAETYADIATSAPVLQAARARVRQPSAAVSAKADYFTRLLTISAQARGRAAAAAMADAVTHALMRATGPRRPGTPGDLTVLGPVETSTAANEGRRKTLVAIAALAGLLATLTLLVSVDRRRRPAAAPRLAAGAA
jgi:capsular polysaccharide biosynthesis protein